ncbi:hypothetical protein [Pedobacter gandavensis]|uniref:hypothetical protein n=1 Tax=Pedobacter gandavensis TaxID=2679963 RepID=UPI00292E506B|nr:hypothetical protein [Pedobacter gandavensis]
MQLEELVWLLLGARDPSSSGRAQAVKSASFNLAVKQGVNNTAGGLVGNTIQKISDAGANGNNVEKNNDSFYRNDLCKIN